MNTPFDPLCARYPSRRYPIYARGGMVNCSSPLASAAGLEVLRRGGCAVDAAVAAAAALKVVEPTANGLGSDAFALVWSEKEKKLFVYEPEKMHDYSKEQPSLVDIGNGHMVFGSPSEIEKYKAQRFG